MSVSRPSRTGFEKAGCSDEDEDDASPASFPSSLPANPVPSSLNSNDGGDGGCEECSEDHTSLAFVDGLTRDRLSRVPRLFRYDHKPPEATALAMDIFARATVLMSSIFLGPALLELAAQQVEASCQLLSHDDSSSSSAVEDCVEQGRVYGFRPSSLLSNIAIVSGLLVSFGMPFLGAIVDYTHHRWLVGAVTAGGLVLVKGIEAMVSAQTWFAVASLQVLSSLFFNAHITVTYAYTSELSTDTQQQTAYNTYYVVVLYIATLAFLIFVTALSFGLQQDDVGTARISQVTTSTVSALLFGWAWKYFFRPRPAISTIPPGQSLASAGVRKVVRTVTRIVAELPALKWLLLAIMMGEAATNTLITVATSYMKVFLEMDANEIGLVFLAVLVMGGPGSKLGGWIALRCNPITSAILCHLIFTINTTVAAVSFSGPEHKHYMPLPGAIWGLCLGWLLPMHSTAFITTIPRGQQEAELMGLYILAGQSLSWLPPMLFTALNEAGVTMAIGLASLDVFFLAATICLLMVNKTMNSLMDSRTTKDLLVADPLQGGSQPSETSTLEPTGGNTMELDDMATTPSNSNAAMQHRRIDGHDYSLPTIT